MYKKIIVPMLMFAFVQQAVASSYPMQEFEMVVVESLSESINLSMGLSDIEDTKKTSRVGQTKAKIREVVTQRLLGHLQGNATNTNFNLLELAQTIPVTEILSDVMAIEAEINKDGKLPAADFSVIIMPKVPKGSLVGQGDLPYQVMYSPNKASVITDDNVTYKPQLSHAGNINLRVQKAIRMAYQRNYIQQGSNDPFFVGALFNIHLNGQKSSIKTQILGGLPTDKQEAFTQEELEVKVTSFNYPKSPTIEDLAIKEYPGAIITLLHTPGSETDKGQVKIQFGSLSQVEGTNWEVTDLPIAFEDQWGVPWVDMFGIPSFKKDHNTPHLLGEPKALIWSWIDPYFQWNYNLRFNIHEVEISLDRLEIDNIRATMDFIKKDGYSFWNSGAIPLPTLELPEKVSGKFKGAGNDMINAEKKKIEPILNSEFSKVLENPAVQKQLLDTVTGMLTTENGGQQ